MNKETFREIRKIIILLGLIILVIMYSDVILEVVGKLVDVTKPFIIGAAIAFVINIPMSLIENKLLCKWKGKAANKLKRAVSIVLSMLLLIAVIALVVFTVAPQLANTVKDISHRLPEFGDQINKFIEIQTEKYPEVKELIGQIGNTEIDWSSIMSGITSFAQTGASGLVSSTFNMASSIAGFFVRAVVSIVFALYILAGKEKLGRQIKRCVKTYVPNKIYKKINYVAGLLADNFRRFIMGQCLEAVILGTLFGIFMMIFDLPYALLIAVLISFAALIPVAGAFIGCFIGAFLILMISPIKMIGFLILFIILQQFEGQVIYPRVVGNSVGLPAIWVFVAVTTGGSLMGILGMLIFIPIASTIYMLIREDVRFRNEKVKVKDKEKEDK